MPSPSRDPLRRVRFLLVSPKSPGNVGAAARAVKNMGIGRLDVLEPVAFRDPAAGDQEARRMASKAADVLARVRFFSRLEEAVPPRTYLVATTARGRRSLAPASPRERAAALLAIARERPVAVLFGNESRGLPNRLLERASEGLTLPAAAGYPVLNLAQAVMLVAYELRLASRPAPAPAQPLPRPAAAELDALQREAVDALARIDFLKPHHRDRVTADLAGLLARAAPTAREVRMLRGVCRQVRWVARLAGRDVEP